MARVNILGSNRGELVLNVRLSRVSDFQVQLRHAVIGVVKGEAGWLHESRGVRGVPGLDEAAALEGDGVFGIATRLSCGHEKGFNQF